MAKKKRVPAPPRPVQAPKRRVEPRDPRRTRLLFIALGALLVLVAGGVGIAFAVGGGSGGDEGVAGACERETFEAQGARHVDELPEKFEYNSDPPTSGPHWGQPRGPAIWNIYDRAVPDLALLHNLEHGGIVVQYGAEVPQREVQALTDWYADDPNGIVVSPAPEDAPASLEDKITLRAWTHLATCTAFDEDAFSDFRDDYRGPEGDAPEKFPLEALQPGSQ